MQYLVERYGNKAENAAANLRLWEAFGRVFEAWRNDWDCDTTENRAHHALKMARAGAAFRICIPSIACTIASRC
eukprot:4966206-Pleurochrysis_carterae.AAC.1